MIIKFKSALIMVLAIILALAVVACAPDGEMPQRSDPVTEADVTTAETTEAPDDVTTTEGEETVNPDNTDSSADSTTAESETTTSKPEETTAKPEETTAVPEVTTSAPEETANPPEDTSAAPDDTTAVPEDTTAVPEDTTAVPDDTTSIPDDTTAPPVHSHVFGEWQETKIPACTVAGEERRVCDCGESEIRPIAAKGHTEVVQSAVGATCTESGLCEGKYCSVCGEVTAVQSVIPALGHSEESVKGVSPTCTESGLGDGKRCKTCGEITEAQSVIPALGHTEGEWVTDKEATDTEDGLKKLLCSVCGETVRTEIISVIVHTPGEWVTDKAATCTEDGSKHLVCADCGKSLKTESIPALGHKEVTDKAVAATCTASGLTEGKHCSVCSAVLVKQTTVAALGHKEVTDKAVAATCTTAGKTEGKHCSVCSAVLVKQTTVAALGHKEVVDKAVAATCTTAGKTEGKHCSVCSAVLGKQTTVAALGHKEVTDKAVAATCTTAGKTEGKHCSVCSAVLVKQTTVAALGHKEVVDKAVAATCTTAGKTEGKHCSVCSAVLVKQTTVAALGHKEVTDKAVAATCTASGLTEGKHCSVCSAVLVKQTTVAALGHKEVTDKAVAATCTASGLTEGKHCSVCSAVLVKQTTVAALGHKDGAWVVDKDADCKSTGSKHQECSVCGATLKTETIPISGHNRTVLPGRAATATEPGLTDGVYCTGCNTVFEAQKPTFPTGYDVVSNYANDYGYKYLGTMQGGSNLQKLYNRIDEAAKKFHTDSTVNASDGIVATLNYSDLGLSLDQAVSVWATYKNDHPLYYWISNTVSYSSTSILLIADTEYVNGSDRASYNALIYAAVEEYLDIVEGESSAYHITFGLHDAIIEAADYAYESDGVTPSYEAWAHNILGILEKGSGVCESYSEVFALLLNYCDVENLIVTGIGNGGAHQWNMVKLDDGEWYWYDLTWDDQPTWMTGVLHTNFAVNDTQDNTAYIGNYTVNAPAFTPVHVADDTGLGIDFLYALPERSDGVYETSDTQIYDKFTQNGKTYQVIGYDKVLGTSGAGSTVTYNGREYTVVVF